LGGLGHGCGGLGWGGVRWGRVLCGEGWNTQLPLMEGVQTHTMTIYAEAKLSGRPILEPVGGHVPDGAGVRWDGVGEVG
jgi:hypothetical protein